MSSMMLKTVVLVLTVATALTACNRASKREKRTAPVSAQKANTNELNKVFRSTNKWYNAEEQSLPNKIDGIEAKEVWRTERIDTPAGFKNISHAQFSFRGLVFDHNPVFTLQSKVLKASEVTSWTDLTIIASKELSQTLGGVMSAKAKCLDEACDEIALLISVSTIDVAKNMTELSKIKMDARNALTSKKANAEQLTILRAQLEAGREQVEAGRIQPNQNTQVEVDAITNLMAELDVRIFDLEGLSPMAADAAAGIDTNGPIPMAGYIFKATETGYKLEHSVGATVSIREALHERRRY